MQLSPPPSPPESLPARSTQSRLRARVWQILEPAERRDHLSQLFDIGLIVLVLLNVLAAVVETVDSIGQRYENVFTAFEFVSVAIFACEYVLRLWSCTVDPRFGHPVWGRLRFVAQPLMLIDLLAILPAFLPMLDLDARTLRGFRLFRIFRVLKLGRYSTSLQLIARVFKAKATDLLVILFTLAILLLIASSLVYFAEHDAQPQSFSSIPATMWWGVVTMTTVGYGDMYPVTIAGKMLGGMVALLGVGLFALPAGILASGFSEEFGKRRGPYVCPTCGQHVKAAVSRETSAEQ